MLLINCAVRCIFQSCRGVAPHCAAPVHPMAFEPPLAGSASVWSVLASICRIGRGSVPGADVADGAVSEHPGTSNPLPWTAANRPTSTQQSRLAGSLAPLGTMASGLKRGRPGARPGRLGCASSAAASQLSSKGASVLPPLVLLFLCFTQGVNAQTIAEVRIGGLFQHTAAKLGRFAAFVMAIEEINNSTDLLPHTTLR